MALTKDDILKRFAMTNKKIRDLMEKVEMMGK
jgi:hypothetical protein